MGVERRRSRETRMQHPILTALDGGAQTSEKDFAAARNAAAVEIARAYERALTMLHPWDVDEQAWYREQLRDARCAARLSPVDELASGRAQQRSQPA